MRNIENEPTGDGRNEHTPINEEARKEIWLRELAEFIVEASLNTWPARKGQVEPTRKGFKRHIFESEDGTWRLDDEYAGHFKAPGTTIVFYKDIPVWAIQYGGKGMLPGCEKFSKETFVFLKEALLKITPDLPFRGPRIHVNGDWEYRFILEEGDMVSFKAKESISNQNVLRFEQDIMGELILEKDENRNVIFPWNL